MHKVADGQVWHRGTATSPVCRATIQIRPQPGFVDVEVAVLASVEQHDRQPIAEFRSQRRVLRRRDVHIDHLGDDAVVRADHAQLLERKGAEPAACPREQSNSAGVSVNSSHNRTVAGPFGRATAMVVRRHGRC